MFRTMLDQMTLVKMADEITRNSATVYVLHYSAVILGAMASQITRLTIVNSTVYSGADQRKYQSFASVAFVWGIRPVKRKLFSCDDVVM